MNTFALILACAAVLCFIAMVAKSRYYWLLPFGLACFAASFIVQLVFMTGPTVSH